MSGPVIDQSGVEGGDSSAKANSAQWAEYILARGLLGFFRLIGVDAASALAGGFLRTVGPLLKGIHARGQTNIAIAFPKMTPKEREALLRNAWENLGRTSAEYSNLGAFDPALPNARVEVIGADTARAAAASGPVVFISAHLANWEIMAIVLASNGIDHGVLYRAANNPLVDDLICRLRAEVMSSEQIPKGPRGARALIEAMRSARSLAMLADQKLNDGLSAPFFGRPAMTAPTAARLSLRYGAAIIPAGIARTGGARFRMTFRERIAFTPSGDAAADIAALTARINEALEREIREAPGQWLWFHRRYSKDVY